MAHVEHTGFLPIIGGLFTAYRVGTTVWGWADTLGMNPTSFIFGGSSGGGAKDVMAGSFTSMLAMAAGGVVMRTLFSSYGMSVGSSVAQSMASQFWSSAPLPLQAAAGGKKKKEASEAQWNAWRVAGAAHDTVNVISKHSRTVMLFLLTLMLQYLHWLGAYEMKRKMEARAATDTSTTALTTTKDDKATTLVDAVRARANASAKQSVRKQGKDTVVEAVRDAESFGGGGDDEGDDGVLESMLRGIYMSDAFYHDTETGKQKKTLSRSYIAFKPTRYNVVSMLVNVLLGFTMQVNALFTGSSHLAGTDPISTAARVTALCAYWELMARALRLYGWAPVYLATQQVTRLLLLSSKPPKKRQRGGR